ncbi:MAG: pyridoxamine 5'-phosphate oxidase family protein [Gammaproteobacteria bacterium]
MPDFTMAPARLQAFLDQPLYASVTSLRRTGAPFTAPLGFIHEEGCVYLTVGGTRPVIQRITRDPRICVCVFDQDFPPSYVIMEGRAAVMEDPGHAISMRIGRKYMTRVPGLDLAAFEKNWLAEGRTVFRMPVENYLSTDGKLITNFEEDASISPVEHRRRQ